MSNLELLEEALDMEGMIDEDPCDGDFSEGEDPKVFLDLKINPLYKEVEDIEEEHCLWCARVLRYEGSTYQRVFYYGPWQRTKKAAIRDGWSIVNFDEPWVRKEYV